MFFVSSKTLPLPTFLREWLAKKPSPKTETALASKPARCRIAWMVIATGYIGYDAWHDQSEVNMLASLVRSGNANDFIGTFHWLECE